jgi:aspartokinase/homoserine dehydrogenase 1
MGFNKLLATTASLLLTTTTPAVVVQAFTSVAAPTAFKPHHALGRLIRSTVSDDTELVQELVIDAAAAEKMEPGGAQLEDSNEPKKWEVHKFGGASLATAKLYKTVGDLLIAESKQGGQQNQSDSSTGSATSTSKVNNVPTPTMAIVSARGGMTDLLVKVVDCALVDFQQAQIALDEAVQSQIDILLELVPAELDRQDITQPIVDRIQQDAQDILSVVQSLRMIQMVPPVTMEVVTGFGEIWSAQTLWAYLQTCTDDVVCDWMDARDVLVVKSDGEAGLGTKGSAASTAGVTPLYDDTHVKLDQWWEKRADKEGGLQHLIKEQQQEQQSTSSNDNDNNDHKAPILVVTGFVAISDKGVPTTLKRSGSDYSATIFGKLFEATRVTMWKNTDGVYTADPRRVPEAFSIESLKYDEAMELAYFGAQVLHPSAMEPCIQDNIPVYVRNIFNPAFKGTVIQGRSPRLCDSMQTVAKSSSAGTATKHWKSRKGVIPIKGITSVDEVSLVTLEGASVMGGANVAERFMGAMAIRDINVLIITQASSEASITVAVPMDEGDRALLALEEEFELELARSTVGSVSISTGMAIVAIVGEGMALTSGVSSTFLSSLARANVNIRLIAQGSSERQVAVVVASVDASRALRAVHMAFTLSTTTASVAILGATGAIGSCLIQQMESQRERLKDNLDLCVTLAATSTKMVVAQDSRGLCSDDLCYDYLSALLCKDKAADHSFLEGEASDTETFDLEQVTKLMGDDDVNPLRVIIDCTNSEATSEYYETWLQKGINVISPSFKVAAGDYDRYKRVCQAEEDHAAKWQYESSVGAALPICTTLRDFKDTGDVVHSISGCVSGTMAFVFSQMCSAGVSFSEAVRGAIKKSICENDARVDLSGQDMCQKVVILARTLGLEVNMEDVEVESLLPPGMLTKDYKSGSDGEKVNDKDTILNAMIADLSQMDAGIQERLDAAQAENKVLRYKFVIDSATSKCVASLQAVDSTDPLFRLKLNENLVAFETARYETSPLIVKGAAAGPNLAAAGIFADLLRVTRAHQD